MLTLHLYDRTDNFYRRRGYADEYCASRIAAIFYPASCTPAVDTINTPVANIKDVENELNRIAGLGKTVDSLWFHSHGVPGVVNISRNGAGLNYLDWHTVWSLTPACQKALASPGRVFFAGCNVGEGARGEKFLLAAGAAMLGHGGGIMLAATSRTFSHPGLGQRLPPWGSVRVAKVSPGGAVSISTV